MTPAVRRGGVRSNTEILSEIRGFRGNPVNEVRINIQPDISNGAERGAPGNSARGNELPDGWVIKTSRTQDGKIYYLNVYTSDVQWNAPKAAASNPWHGQAPGLIGAS